MLNIKEHDGGGRPPKANKRKWADLHEALSKYKADLEKMWDKDNYQELWSQSKCFDV